MKRSSKLAAKSKSGRHAPKVKTQAQGTGTAKDTASNKPQTEVTGGKP